MKIRKVSANNRRKAFEVEVDSGTLAYPYGHLALPPKPGDRISEVYVDPEAGDEAFTYVLESGAEDTVHLDAVLEHNEDPEYLREILLYRLTVEARNRIAECPLSKREVVRRLRTSASQLYRLLDPTNYRKSVGQMLALLHVLGCDVEVTVKDRDRKSA